MASSKIGYTTLAELKARGRREPAIYAPAADKPCIWCGKATIVRLRDFPVCLKCNDRPENRGADGLADLPALVSQQEAGQ